MLTRIVRLSFDPEKIETFLANFEANKQQIRAFEGCEYLEVWRDVHNTNVFFTHSKWLSEDHLNAYRDSELFTKIWSATKVLFNDKPQAWSVTQMDIVQ